MNVFFTNKNPIVAAKEHCKVHTRKMIVEYAQLLSTAHHELDSKPLQGIYKTTHKNHPSAIWVRKDLYNYNWVLHCALELCKIYTKHTNKLHATEKILKLLLTPPTNIPCNGFINPPVAAPDKYKGIGIFQGVDKAYQLYLSDKFKEWTSREKPIKVEFYTQTPQWLAR